MDLPGKKTTVYSAYKLEPAEVDFLVKKFNFIDKNKLENIVDKKIIAGVIICHRNQIIDLSLKTKLDKLKNRLYEISK